VRTAPQIALKVVLSHKWHQTIYICDSYEWKDSGRLECDAVFTGLVVPDLSKALRFLEETLSATDTTSQAQRS